MANIRNNPQVSVRDNVRSSAVRSSGAPNVSQQDVRQRCSALQDNGKECGFGNCTPDRPRCSMHHAEHKSLYATYKAAQRHYDAIKLSDSLTADQMREKIKFGKETVDIRNKVHQRFWSHEIKGNRGHVRWILKTMDEIHVLETRLETTSAEETVDIPSQDTASDAPKDRHGAPEEKDQALKRVSLLSMEVPMERLQHLPEDHPVRTIKSCLLEIHQATLQKLYGIVPGLNDARDADSPRSEDSQGEVRHDVGDHILRYMLRGFIAWKAEPEILADASKANSVDEFLRRRNPTELQSYIKFFEALGELRPDTLHFLRDAVCDYLTPLNSPGVSILGASIFDDSIERNMTVEGWDILYQWFNNAVSWANVESFCQSFNDALLIKRLLALGRYRALDDPVHGWYDQNHDVSQESVGCLMLGFVPTSKGYSDELDPQAVAGREEVLGTQYRNYATGRMAVSDPRSTRLMSELGSRIAHFHLTVFEGRLDWFHQKTVFETEQCQWIRKEKKAHPSPNADAEGWEITWTPKMILQDLKHIRQMRKEGFEDFYHFILIDRYPNRPFHLWEEILSTLAMISEKRSTSEWLSHTITQNIPENEREAYHNFISMPWESSYLNYRDTVVRYEYGRTRAWDVDLAFIKQQRKVSVTYRDSRIMDSILRDMEEHGIVSLESKHQTPITVPIVVRATDGREDIYFAYDFGPARPVAELTGSAQRIFSAIPSQSALREFIASYISRHPGCIFARGKISTHYCAWPMPAISRHGKDLNFCTLEGRIYTWKFMPFDVPYASNSWHYMLECYIHSKLDFVRFRYNTFVICANDAENGQRHLKSLLDEADKHGWKLSVSGPNKWSSDIESLDLDVEWTGIYPAKYR